MKKAFVITMVLFMSLMVVGCKKPVTKPSNSFSLQMAISEFGGVSQTVSLPTFSKQLLGEYDEEEIEKYIFKLKSEIENKLYNSYYLKYWFKYLENPKVEYIIGGGLVEFIPPVYNKEEDLIYFSFNFLTPSVWSYYNPSTSTSSVQSEEEIAFITKTSSQTTFPFFGKDSQGNIIADFYIDFVDKIYFQNFSKNLKRDNIKFSYIYTSPYKRTHSNADMKWEDEKGVNHLWVKSKESLNNESKIEIWYLQADQKWWYLASLVGILILGVFVFFGIYLNKKKQKNKSL